MSTIYRAYVETRSFTFEGFSLQSVTSAKAALHEGLLKHAAQFKLDHDWIKEVESDVSYTEYEAEHAFRDRTKII